jgi:predicted ATP-grasp superfamily ATP-dependent carboligase
MKGVRVADGNLIILGASARAAAFSALRAGLRPWCADLFADLDLRRRCPAVRLRSGYPRGFLKLIDAAPPGPWMYTGGLENRPTLIGKLSRRRPLWGNGPAQLRRARDPWFVQEVLKAAGLPVPALGRNADELAPSLRWLHKPLRGAGGAGIGFGKPGNRGRGKVYFQEFVEGERLSVVYAGDGKDASLLGLTRQLVGISFLHAGPFHYCGSIGPLIPTGALQQALQRLGTVLAGRCGLCGLFGVDGVLRDGVFWPVEVNPRYPASVEVLEYATGLRALLRQPCCSPLPRFGREGRNRPDLVGKATLFAAEDLAFPGQGPWSAEYHSPTPLTEPPAFADIPAPGEFIAAGRPVLTFFACAPSLNDCADRLGDIAADLDRQLFSR